MQANERLDLLFQDDSEMNLDSLQEMDMMDMSVLDEADIDNGIPADCEDYDADQILDSLSNDGNPEADPEVGCSPAKKRAKKSDSLDVLADQKAEDVSGLTECNATGRTLTFPDRESAPTA